MPPDDSFDKAPGWLFDGMAAAFSSGAARLAIVGEDPVAAGGPGHGQGGARQPRAVQGLSAGARADHRLRHQLDPSSPARPRPGPQRCSRTSRRRRRVARLWDAIFAASRVDAARSGRRLGGAQRHAACQARGCLNERRYAALRFRGRAPISRSASPTAMYGWAAPSRAKNGIVCNPNIPTEEVFTTPHKDRVEGTCRGHQAALLSGHADRGHRGALRGGPHRRGAGRDRAGGAGPR